MAHEIEAVMFEAMVQDGHEMFEAMVQDEARTNRMLREELAEHNNSSMQLSSSSSSGYAANSEFDIRSALEEFWSRH